jgi:hypothetical protein
VTTGPTPRFMMVQLGPRRRRYRSRLTAAAVLVLALVVQMGLVVFGVVVVVLASGRCHRRHTKRLLPALLAGRAVIAQGEPATAVEEWAATWLAILAGGRAQYLRRAAGLVVALEENPWRAHVATARLEAADDALTSGRVPGLAPSLHRVDARGRVAAWGGVAAALVVLSDGAALWWLLPLGVTLAALTFALRDLEESRVLPKLLAAEAANPELTAGSWGENEGPVVDLILLSGGDHRCLRRARLLVEDDPRPLTGRDVAVRQLRAAESTVQKTAGRFLLISDGGRHWWIG